MRVLIALTILGVPSLAIGGGFPWPWAKQPPACAAQPSCDFQPPCGPKELPPTKEAPPTKEGPPPEEQVELEETGVYVAPPRTGATRGPINRTGIEGMSITLPQMKLSMPSLELPCFYHGRSEARMMIDAAEAPYVRTGYQVKRYATQAPATAAAPEAEKEAAPKAPTPMDCETQLKQLEDKYMRLQDELNQCLQQQRSLQGSNKDSQPAPSKSLTPQQAPVPAAEGSARRQQLMVNPASYHADHFALQPIQRALPAAIQPSAPGLYRLPPVSESQDGGWTPRR